MMDNLKTGLIYDQRLSEHHCRRKHLEGPERVSAIIEALHAKHYLTHPRVYLSNIERLAQDQELLWVHSQKYIKYVTKLWPKASHRVDITVLDSYFNEASQKVARMAVGALLTASDKILHSQWKNAFAIIRPPGHHSGARNTINGFCIYNNVAVAAQYLLKHHKLNKVAILDWDIHHGDGTQQITQANQKILYISIHRHDRGTFYPGSLEGWLQSNGKGEAKGTKVNIPINHIDASYKEYDFQAAGDNEYIYIYHRIVQPILQAFCPDFILVSAGFGAALGDPKGGFTVTPYCFYYLTKKVVSLGKKTLLALEGGYNLTATSAAASAVMAALLGQKFMPQRQNLGQAIIIHEQSMKMFCCLPQVYHDQLEKIIDFHSVFWPCLKNKELQDYQMLIKAKKQRIYGIVEKHALIQSVNISGGSKPEGQNLKQLASKASQDNANQHMTTQFYFAAGHLQRFKDFSLNNDKFMKWAHEPEIKFYESNFEEAKFAPEYFGRSGEHIIIENLLFQEKEPVIIDIKMSRQAQNPFISQTKRERELRKEEMSTTEALAFRISGYTTPNFKEGGLLTSDGKIVREILKKVVTIHNRHIFVDYLSEFKGTLQRSKRKYYGTSILLIRGIKSTIKWVDFHYWESCQQVDHNLIEGIKNLSEFIQDLDLTYVI